MNTIQTEAVAIVHAGLADVLAWLGEKPATEHRARHAKPEYVVITDGGTYRLAWAA